MSAKDYEILEILSDHGKLVPGAFREIEGVSHETVKNRLPVLEEHELVEKYLGVRGLYDLTDKGRSWLQGERLDTGSE